MKQPAHVVGMCWEGSKDFLNLILFPLNIDFTWTCIQSREDLHRWKGYQYSYNIPKVQNIQSLHLDTLEEG